MLQRNEKEMQMKIDAMMKKGDGDNDNFIRNPDDVLTPMIDHEYLPPPADRFFSLPPVSLILHTNSGVGSDFGEQVSWAGNVSENDTIRP